MYFRLKLRIVLAIKNTVLRQGGSGGKGAWCQSGNLSLILRTYRVQRENWLLQAVLWPPPACIYIRTCTHTINKWDIISIEIVITYEQRDQIHSTKPYLTVKDMIWHGEGKIINVGSVPNRWAFLFIYVWEYSLILMVLYWRHLDLVM